ncbi:MAG TPA: hypothetical protein VI895_15280 [Bdellovibrionota bacterium]|nr:hypothetical protein [Bdellovibrionota bacterium]
MSLKLQVLVPEKDMKFFKGCARKEKLSLGEWVRRAMHQYAGWRPRKSAKQKLEAIDRLSKLQLPVGTVEEMNREIELGRNLPR